MCTCAISLETQETKRSHCFNWANGVACKGLSANETWTSPVKDISVLTFALQILHCPTCSHWTGLKLENIIRRSFQISNIILDIIRSWWRIKHLINYFLLMSILTDGLIDISCQWQIKFKIKTLKMKSHQGWFSH